MFLCKGQHPCHPGETQPVGPCIISEATAFKSKITTVPLLCDGFRPMDESLEATPKRHVDCSHWLSLIDYNPRRLQGIDRYAVLDSFIDGTHLYNNTYTYIYINTVYTVHAYNETATRTHYIYIYTYIINIITYTYS